MNAGPAAAPANGAVIPAPDPVLVLDDVSVDYGGTRVLHGVDLSVRGGELIALLGPSGSGKTTIIRTIAGFIVPSGGHISLHGERLDDLPVHRREIGMVFQSYALFPHMTVRENIAYPLKVQRKSTAQIRSRVDELVQLVQLDGHVDKRPSRLSGGQQQRVALARALAMDPELLLLDEPLSNLDANLRREVGEEIRRLQQRTGTTTVMVTHDRQEAYGMADRIAVLEGGRIRQLDTPNAIYRRPVNRFMATFAGDGNLLAATGVRADGSGSIVGTEIGDLRSTMSLPNADTVLVRPEDIEIVDQHSGIPAVVKSTYYYGATLQVELDAAGTTLHGITAGTRAESISAGDRVGLRIDPSNAILLAGEPA